jgi:tetratricopeptide (TPR) repeat protein
VNGPGTSFAAHASRPLYYSLGGDFEMAAEALVELETDYPASELWPAWGGVILGFSSWDTEAAEARSLELQNVPDGASWRRTGTRALGLTAALSGEIARSREIMNGAVTEAQRADAWNDVAQTWADLAVAEDLIGSGDPSAALDALADRALQDQMQARYRNNEQWISILAWTDREADARRLLSEWEDDAADLQAAAIQRTSEVVDAFSTRATDPAAGAAVLVRLRTTERCARCWAWELGVLYEAAGMTAEALTERERSLEAGQDFYFGFHRLAAHEALGRLHDEMGNTAEAIEYYRIYVEQLSDGPELPRVQRAIERLAALQGAG